MPLYTSTIIFFSFLISSFTLILHRIPVLSSECFSFVVSSPHCSYICNSSLFLICWCLSCPSSSFHKNVRLLIYLSLSEFCGVFSNQVSTSTGPIHFSLIVLSFRRLKNSRIWSNTENYTEECFKNTYTYCRIGFFKSDLIMLRWILGIEPFLCDTDIAFCSVN